MKKILIATTALVATAGFAAADVSFSGEAEMGFEMDVAGNWTVVSGATLSTAMTGETDGGLGFGASFDLTTGEDNIGSEVVYIEGGFGKLSVGDVDNAAIALVNDIADAEQTVGAADMLYTGTFGDFSVAASYELGGLNDYGVGAAYTLGDYNLAAGYGEADTVAYYVVSAGTTFGDISLAASYTGDDADNETYGVEAGYVMGAATVTANYRSVNDVAGFGLDVEYDLGGGATLEAGIDKVDGTDPSANLGLSFVF